VVAATTSESAGATPLSGIVVVDLTRYVAGSYASMLLASLGAAVIKVEDPAKGDPYRGQGTVTLGGESALFLGLNSGKQSLAVDLKSPEGRDIMETLLGSADVLVENSRPGSLEALGLGYAQVSERFPGLVYTSISGYGSDGSRASKGGFDLTLQAASGIMSVTGTADGGPTKVGVPMMDIGSALCACVGVLSALLQRAQTGRGTWVRTSLFEFGLATMTSIVSSISATGETPGRLGSHSPSFSPYGAFRTASDYVVLAGAGNENLWRKLCEAVGLPDLPADARFLSNADRIANRDELTDLLEGALSARPAEDWIGILEASGVPAETVASIPDVLASPDTAALGLLQRLAIDGDTYLSVTPPFSVGERPVYAMSAPHLGEHTRTILGGLGFDSAAIDDLAARGIVAAR
jgi:crotonobetainyl-CoA:carnitine CoA-transferase CaiB-like acyl-CoA transferase